ncbi:MAG: S8 family serine peptidase [Terriglobia bacterium]
MRRLVSTRLFSITLGLTLVVLLPGLGEVASAAGRRRYVPDELLVKFKAGTPRQVMADIHRGVGAAVLKGFRSDPGLYQVKIPKGWGLEKALAYYSTRADVQYAQPNWIYHIAGTTTNDPDFGSQWAWENTGQSNGTPGADTHATAAWDKGHGRFSVVVAVIDTGVDYLHPDLALNIWTNPGEAGALCNDGIDNDGNGFIDDCRGWNFFANNNQTRDDNGHGTHVAGTIGAQGNNALGVTGANWDVQIMPIKFMDAAGTGDTAKAISGIDYALDNGARILNNSWAAGGDDPALLSAIKRAEDDYALFVTVAGNSGGDNDSTPFYPCSYSSASFTGTIIPPANILCVAGTDDEDARGGNSNYGLTTVHLGAPGVAIYSTYLNQIYTFFDGTSTAAPHVSGAAALLKGCKASLDLLTVRQILLDTARGIPALSGLTVTGGVVDYAAAINDSRAAGTGACDPAPSNTPPVANLGGPYGSNFRKPVLFDGTGSYDPDGQILIYLWDFGDGTTAVGPSVVHQYTAGGNYTVTLTVRDNLGGIGTQTTTAAMRPTKR